MSSFGYCLFSFLIFLVYYLVFGLSLPFIGMYFFIIIQHSAFRFFFFFWGDWKNLRLFPEMWCLFKNYLIWFLLFSIFICCWIFLTNLTDFPLIFIYFLLISCCFLIFSFFYRKLGNRCFLLSIALVHLLYFLLWSLFYIALKIIFLF